MRRAFPFPAAMVPVPRLAVLFFVLLLALSPVIVNGTKIEAESPSIQGDGHFGINWINVPGSPASAQRLAQAAAVGASWDRFPFYWINMQPTAGGAIDFSSMDQAVDADVANGRQVLGVLLDAPQWAISGHISAEAWRSFVSQTVSHYKGRVKAWEIWNEPDITTGGVTWYWSVADYYELMKVAYTAIKAADPEAQVVIGALACPNFSNGFFPALLAEMSRDATAASNNYYCDVLSLHLYSRQGSLYDMPTGYVGTPEFAGFHNLMQNCGFDKPIWITETGVGIWDTGTGQIGPGRATMAEHASFVIQAYASALVAGVEKIFLFQFYDDGATTVNMSTENRAEYYGLVSNAGEVRPGYAAYQTAARYFSNAQLVTRVNVGRDGSADVKGIDIITMYGTPNGKVTVLWNNDGNPNVPVRLAADSSAAVLVDKLGNQQSIAAVDGVYTITLAAATNNNNANYRANDYIMGGDPVILVEPDYRVPAVVVESLPSGVRSPFTVSWKTTDPANQAATYDVQYMDTSDGVWRTWLTGTSATASQFGTDGTTTQLNHTYVFRVRARDTAGNLLGGYDFPGNGMASTVVLGGNVVSSPPSQTPAVPIVAGIPVQAKIEVVWPHGGLAVSQATLVNIGANLFVPGSFTSVNSSFDRPVKLFRALNNGVEEEVASGKKTLVTKNGLTFPTWEFNDIDVSQACDPANRYFFRVAAAGVNSTGNVWAHGTDARTNFPQLDVPTGVLATAPAIVDGKVEIVWPHDNLPVDKATKANIGVYLFGHGTLASVPASYDRPVKLLRTLNNGVEEEVAVGEKVMKTVGDLTFPSWQFNNIDISAACDGSSQYYFRVSIDGVRTFSNVWSHGVDARTYLPQPDVPTGVRP